MQDILNTIREFLMYVNPLWVYLFVSVVGLFIYWRGCNETRKNRSSIFDSFIISITSGLLMARVSYLVDHWSEYSNFAWYWLPYERYGDTMYFFRLNPWRIIRIWDGGITIFVAMITFLLIVTIFAILVKKWRWYQLFFPIFFSMTTMLGVSFLYVGLLQETTIWLVIGAILMVIPLIFWIISKFLLVSITNGVKRRKTLVYIGVILVTLTSLFISYQYVRDTVTSFESGSVIALLIWTVIMDIFTIIDINRPNVTIERVSSVRAVDIEINQPIKIH